MELALPSLSQVSRVYAEDGELLAELHDGRNSEPVPLSLVPDLVQKAVLAAEDKDFYEHSGVDFGAIASAALFNLSSSSLRGGSTITQQVVKNTFVGNETSIRRKIAEAFVSAEVERRFSKDQIFEFYLNSVYFGAGAYGIKTAGLEYFGKDLGQLTPAEAATLAVLVRNPTLYNPRRRPEQVLDRRNDTLQAMADEGWISETQAASGKRQPLGVIEHVGAPGLADHIVAEVKRQLLNDPEFAFLGDTNEERKRAVFGCPADVTTCTGGGGLRIETTIDLTLQNLANDILSEWFPLPSFNDNLALCQGLFPSTPADELPAYAETNSCSPTGSIATVDNATGAVKVMASGLPFGFSQFDLAVQGRRNPGSAFKVFGLVAALENGITLGNTYSGASPMDLICPSICSDRGNIWTVHNAGAGYGRISLEQATYASVNTVYAQLALQVGPEKVVEVAHRMGITSSLAPVPSIVLGSGAVSPMDMASAYSNFATNGVWAKPFLISRITDAAGNVIYGHEMVKTQVIDPLVAAAARIPLLKVPSSAGTAVRAQIDRPQGGKTGTHQEYRDAWYVGFVPQYTTAVWTGYEQQQIPLTDVNIHGERYARVFGGSVPAPIWAEFMLRMLEGVEPIDFPPDPVGIETYLLAPTVTVPAVVGLDEPSAVAAITASSLTPVVLHIPAFEPIGMVVFQSFEPGGQVEKGLPMKIYVSNGLIPAASMPPVVGITLSQAYKDLNLIYDTTGMRVAAYAVCVPVADPAQVDIVLTQDPPAGTPLSFGHNVWLNVGAAICP
jgi:penicillin-binding protein 1A